MQSIQALSCSLLSTSLPVHSIHQILQRLQACAAQLGMRAQEHNIHANMHEVAYELADISLRHAAWPSHKSYDGGGREALRYHLQQHRKTVRI
jgi:hypothetical protein